MQGTTTKIALQILLQLAVPTAESSAKAKHIATPQTAVVLL